VSEEQEIRVMNPFIKTLMSEVSTHSRAQGGESEGMSWQTLGKVQAAYVK